MTETPSKWAMEKAAAVEDGIHQDDACTLTTQEHYAIALDAARAEGEAKGRREALEEAAGLFDDMASKFQDEVDAMKRDGKRRGFTGVLIQNVGIRESAAARRRDDADAIRALIDKETDR